MPSDDKTREETLVARAHNGDDDALCLLLDRCEAVLRRRIERVLPPYVRRRVSASDVMQEVRLVALAKRDEFTWRGDGSFRAWALAIADNKARRAIQHHRDVAQRSVRREVTRTRRPGTRQFLGAHASPSEVAVGKELQALARQAMETLPDDYREVLRLCREEELTMREAGERMGRSREATKKLYGRALARFTALFNRLRGEQES